MKFDIYVIKFIETIEAETDEDAFAKFRNKDEKYRNFDLEIVPENSELYIEAR